MTDIITNDPVNTTSMDDSALKNIKHNTTTVAVSEPQQQGPIALSAMESVGNVSDESKYFISQIKDKSFLQAESYLANYNYDVSRWATDRTLVTDPRTQWIHEYAVAKHEDLFKRKDMASAVGSTIAKHMLSGEQQKYDKEIRELSRYDAAMDVFGENDDKIKYLKEKHLSNIYYKTLANEKIPTDIAYGILTDPELRTLGPDAYSQFMDIMVKQSDTYRDMDSAFGFYGDDWTRVGAFHDRRMEMFNAIRDGEVLDKLNESDLKAMAIEFRMQEHILGKSGFLTSIGEGLMDGMIEQFNSANPQQLDNKPLTSLNLPTDFIKANQQNPENNYFIAGANYALSRDSFLDVVSLAIERKVNPSVVMNEIHNSEYGKTYKAMRFALDWGTLFTGGYLGKGASMAFRTLGMKSIKAARGKIGTALESRVKALGDAANRGDVVAAKTIENYVSAGGELFATLSGIGATTGLMQLTEGVKNVAINDTLNQYRAVEVSNKDAFMKGVTENVLANLAMATVFSAPAIIHDTHGFIRANDNAIKYQQIEDVLSGTARIDANDIALAKMVDRAREAGDLPEFVNIPVADIQSEIFSAIEKDDRLRAKKLQDFLDSHLESASSSDAEIANLSVKLSDLAKVSNGDEDLAKALSSKVILDRTTENAAGTQEQILRMITDTLTKGPYKESELLNTPAKNAHIKAIVENNIVNEIRGKVYADVSDLQVNLKPSEVELFSRRFAVAMNDLASLVGVDPEEFVKKHNLKFKVKSDTFNISDTTNIKELGTFDPNTITISLSKDSGFATLTHETLHFFTEILMREEDAIRARGINDAVKAIDAIRNSFPILQGKRWEELSLNDRELIQESATANYFLNLLGEVAYSGNVGADNLYTANGMFNKAVARDFKRMYENVAEESDEFIKQHGINPNTNIGARQAAANVQNVYEQQVRDIYGVDTTVTKENLRDFNKWFNVFFAREAMSIRVKDAFPIDTLMSTTEDINNVLQVIRDEDPELADTLVDAMNGIYRDVELTEAKAKAIFTMYAPEIKQLSDDVIKSITNETADLGKVQKDNIQSSTDKLISNVRLRTSEARKVYEEDLAKLNNESGLLVLEKQLEDARAARKGIIKQEDREHNRYLENVPNLRQAIQDLSDNAQQLKQAYTNAFDAEKARRHSKYEKQHEHVKELREKLNVTKKLRNESKIKTAEDKLADAQAKLKELKASLKDARKKPDSSDKDIAKLNKQIEQATAQVSARKSDLSAAKTAKYEKLITAAQKRLDDAIVLRDKLMSEVKDTEAINTSILGRGKLKRFTTLESYKEELNEIANHIQTNKDAVAKLIEQNKQHREFYAVEHAKITNLVSQLSTSVKDIKAKYAAEYERLSQIKNSLIENELALIRKYKNGQERFINLHVKTEEKIKQAKKQFENKSSRIYKEYKANLELYNIFDSVVIDEDSFTQAVYSSNMPKRVAKAFIHDVRKKGWLANSNIVPDDKELIDMETLDARHFGNSGFDNVISDLNTLLEFEPDVDKFVRKTVSNMTQQEMGSDERAIRSALQEAEIANAELMFKANKKILDALTKAVFSKSEKLGRGAIISHLASFTQHNVGKLSINSSMGHKLALESRVVMKKAVKALSHPSTWPEAVMRFAQAEVLLRANVEGIRVRNILLKDIEHVKKTMRLDEGKRHQNYDSTLMTAYELLSDRLGITQGKARYHKLSETEKITFSSDLKRLLKETLGSTVESKEIYTKLYEDLNNPNFVGDIYSMPMGNAMSALDTLKLIQSTARDVQKANDELKKADLNQLQREMIGVTTATIETKQRWIENASMNGEGEVSIEKGISESKSNPTWIKKTGDTIRGFFTAMDKVPFLLEKIDGRENGLMYNTIYRPIRDAYDAFNAKSDELLPKIASAFEQVKKIDKTSGVKSTPFKVEVESIIDRDGTPLTRTYTFGASGKYKGHPTLEAFNFILHMGAPDNRAAIARQLGVTDKAVVDDFCKGVITQLGKDGLITHEMMKQAEVIWDCFRELRELTSPVHERITGKKYKPIEGQKIKFDFGEYEGGYVPLSVNERIIKPMDADSLSGAIAQTGDVLDSFTKERVATGGVEYDLSPEALLRRTREQLTYAYLAEPVLNADRFITTSYSLKHNLNSIDYAYDDVIRPWLLDVGTGGASRPQGSRFLNWFANATSTAVMALNMVNALMNFANFTFVAMRNEPKVITKGATAYLTHKRFNGTEDNPTLMQSISAKSQYMAHRLAGNKNSYLRLINRATTNNGVLSKIEMINEGSYVFQTIIQNRIDMIVWSGKYEATYERLVKEHPNAEPAELQAKAVAAADAEIRKTQGSMDLVDTSSLERWPAFTKIVMPFANFFIHQRNLLITQWEMNKREENLWKRYSSQAWLISMGFIANGIATEYIRMAANGDLTNNSDKDTEDNAASAGWALAKGSFSIIHPVAGMFASYTIDKGRGEYTGNGIFSTPALSWGESVGRSLFKAGEVAFADGEFGDKDMVEFARVLGIGIPAAYNATKYTNAWMNIASDNYYDTDALDMARTIVTGKPSADMKE